MPNESRFSAKRVQNFMLNYAIVFMLLAIAFVVWILYPEFLGRFSRRNIIANTSQRFIIALGVSGCLITKGTDLSAGRSVGLAACLAATFLQRADYTSKVYPLLGDLPILGVLLGVVFVTAFFGLLNGMVVSFLKVPPFIATLGMQTVIYGICLIFTGAQPIGGLRTDYTNISSGSFISIPYLGFIALACGVIMWFIYHHTTHGKRMYAIGGNESAAEVSGINTSATKILIYTTAGLLYGVAGFLLGAKSGGTSVNAGFGYELEAIAGCTIGGVSTNGGVGRISGILIGVAVFEVLKIAMQFLGVKTDYTYIVQGIIIVLAVAIDMRKYISKK